MESLIFNAQIMKIQLSSTILMKIYYDGLDFKFVFWSFCHWQEVL